MALSSKLDVSEASHSIETAENRETRLKNAGNDEKQKQTVRLGLRLI